MSTIGVSSLISGTVPRVLTRLSPRSICVDTGSTTTTASSLGNSFSNMNVRFIVHRSAVRIRGIVRGKPTRGTKLLTNSGVMTMSNGPFMNGVIAGRRTVRHLGNPGSAGIGVNIVHCNDGGIRAFDIAHNRVPAGDIATTCVLSSGAKCVHVGGFNRGACPRVLVTLTGLSRRKFGGLYVSLHSGSNNCLATTIGVTGRFLPRGGLVLCARNHGSPHRSCVDSNGNSCGGVPVIILVGRNSTSSTRVFTKTVRSGSHTAVVNHHSFNGKLMRRRVRFPSRDLVHLAVTHCCAPSNEYVRGPCALNSDNSCRRSLLAHCRRNRFFSRSDVGRANPTCRANVNEIICNNNNVAPSVFIPRSALNVASCFGRTDVDKLVLRFTFACASSGHPGLGGFGRVVRLTSCLSGRGLMRRFIICTSGHKLGHHGLLVHGSRGLLSHILSDHVVCGVLSRRT